MNPRRATTTTLLLTLALRALPARAAAPAEVDGYVVALENDHLVVDLGSARGAQSGEVVELWRPVKVRHPVTGQTVTDRFLIGYLRLTQVQERLSLSQPTGELDRPPAAGDVVILRRAATPATAPDDPGASEPPAATSPTATAPCVTGDAPPTDAEVALVTDLFASLSQRDLATRVRAYREFAARHPTSPYSSVLAADALELERTASSPVLFAATSRPERRSFAPPGEATAGEPLTVGVELTGATGAVLHARSPTDVAYASFPMRSAGARYYVATLPGSLLQAPGTRYFIEGVGSDGTAVALVGSAAAPATIPVRPPPRATAPPPQQLRLRLASDAADWNRLRGDDWGWQTEGDLSVRLRDVGLRAVGSGFGVYRGEGGTLEELDDARLPPARVGLTYGYVDLEAGLSKSVGLVGRALVGLTRDGIGNGAQLLLRLGDDQGTHLLLGGETLYGIGLRSITELDLATLPRFPLLFRVEVTNQPAGSLGGDLGARAIAQAGVRLSEHLTVALRASYQGRTIYHAGPGVGGGVTASW